LDADPATIGRNYPVTVGLAGDGRTTLREMIFHLRRLLASGEFERPSRKEAVAAWKADRPPWVQAATLESQELPLKPQRLMAEINRSLPDNAAVFIDSGNNTLWALHYLVANGRNAFLHNWGDFGAMGYGVATPIGGKLAQPQRPVVAIVGDGAFGMLGMEVSTAAAYGIPVIWIVLNDGRFNAVHHGQMIQYKGRTIGTEFLKMDIARIAQGLGARGVVVETPGQMEQTLPELLRQGIPAVIDARIDPDELPPLESRFRSLERFFFGDAQDPVKRHSNGNCY
jgi:acetolactate synthase-1/2/3 large subunit